MISFDQTISKQIHALGLGHMKVWAVISEIGLWFFIPLAVWVWFLYGWNADVARMIFLSIFIGFFGVMLMRSIIKRPRPTTIKTDYKAMFQWSFPSLHASVGFSAATILALLLVAQGGWILWLIAVLLVTFASLVSVTRLFVGVHYATDIAVGAVIGMMIGTLVYVL